MANHLIVSYPSAQKLLSNSKFMARSLQTTRICCIQLCLILNWPPALGLGTNPHPAADDTILQMPNTTAVAQMI